MKLSEKVLLIEDIFGDLTEFIKGKKQIYTNARQSYLGTDAAVIRDISAKETVYETILQELKTMERSKLKGIFKEVSIDE